jgi:preprotein translocase subunit SecF
VGALAPSDGIAGLTMLWKPHHLIRKRTSFDFLGKRKIALVLSSVINLAALVGVFVFGLNFGIDFEGGIAIQVRAKEGQVQLDNLRSELGSLGVGEVALQEFGDKSTALVRVQRQEGNAECVAHADAVMKRRAGNGWSVKPGPDNKTGDVDFTAPNTLDAGGWRDAVSQVGLTLQERQIPRANSNTARIDMSLEQRAEWCQQVAIKVVEDTIKNQYEIRSTESVGPKVGGELMQSGIWAVVATLGAIAVYVWFRFEWQFGVGALLTLAHDIAMTLGFFAFTRLPVDLNVVAAFLTIVGYSLNDTVVIYDRIREDLRKYRKMAILPLLNLSLNETLARTVVTSLTVLIALGILMLIGPQVIFGLAIAIFLGVLIGTYSSIYISAPVLVWLGVQPDSFLKADEKDDAAAQTA